MTRPALGHLLRTTIALGLACLRSLTGRGTAVRDLAVLFDPEYYRQKYPDVAGSAWCPRLHYFLFGGAEGRKPHPMFDGAYYLSVNTDVARLGINPLLHYVLYGAQEGRRPNPAFRIESTSIDGRLQCNSLVSYLINHPVRVLPDAAAAVPDCKSAPPAPGPPAAPVETTANVQVQMSKILSPERQDVSPEAKLRFWAASRELAQAISGVKSLVTVVIPCFNYGKFLWDALGSVLAQTYPNIEVLVMDDGSSDAETLDVLEAIRDPRVRVIHQSNQGLAQTRNNGAAIARGEYLLFLDADDRLEPHAIGLLLYALLRNPKAAYAYSYQRFFGDQELVWAPQSYNAYDLLWANHPSVCSLVRASALHDVGGYSPEMLYGYEDWEFWLRLSGKAHYGTRVDAPVFEHRRHGVTMTHTAHERQRFLHSRIVELNASLYRPGAISERKSGWRPAVSVIVPVYNRAEFLDETLRSLNAQTMQDFELLLVDDGSTDPEALRVLDELSRSGSATVVRCEHGGVATARNKGAELARAELILFLDSDDMLDPTALEKLCWAITVRPDLAFVYSGVVHFGDIQAVVYDEFDPERLHKENFLTVTSIMRRDVYLALGGSDPTLNDIHEDYDFWLRLVDSGHVGMLFHEPLFFYRRHTAGRSTELACSMAAGASDLSDAVTALSQAVVSRHEACKRSMVPLCSAASAPVVKADDPLLAEFESASRNIVPPFVKEERYRRPNLANLFCPERWSGRKTNILYLIPSFHIGGAEVFDLRILSCLPRDRYTVTLVACEQPDGPWYDEFKSNATEVFSLARMGTSPEQRDAFLRYLMMAKSIDIVFNRNTWPGYHLASDWPAVSREVRYVDLLHLHAFGEDWVRASAPFHERLNLRYVVTDDLRQYAVRQYSLAPDRFKVLYFGVEPREVPDRAACEMLRHTLRQEMDISPTAFVVGFVGRITEQKDPLHWLSVAARIAAERPDAVFLVVGDGELMEQCVAKAADLGIAAKVKFAGYRRMAAQYCAAIDVLLMTSRYEGMPLVIFEALAHGAAVVSSDVGGIRECIPAAYGSLLNVDATDAEYARIVLEVGRMRASDGSFGERSRLHVNLQFGIDRMRRQLQEDFSKLTASLDRDQRCRDYQLDLMARPIIG